MCVPYQEDDVRCRCVPGERSVWDFDTYVAPEHKNGIAFLKLWDEANTLLSERGCQRSLSRISAFNSVSLHSHARLGAENIGSVCFLSIGRWQLFMGTVHPYVHLSAHAKSFPTIRLSHDGRLRRGHTVPGTVRRRIPDSLWWLWAFLAWEMVELLHVTQ